MRKWKVKLPGGHVFELESDEPGRFLLEQGHTAFALEELRPPEALPVVNTTRERVQRLTLSVAETAEELGISTKTAYNLVHRADFPTVRIGGRIRVSREGLTAWVRANEQNRREIAL